MHTGRKSGTRAVDVVESPHCCHGIPRPARCARGHHILRVFDREKEDLDQTETAQHEWPRGVGDLGQGAKPE